MKTVSFKTTATKAKPIYYTLKTSHHASAWLVEVLNNIIRKYTMPLSLERNSLTTQKSSEQNVTHIVY